MKKKSIVINVVMMVLSTLIFLAGILLMPFFWQWYEVKLGEDSTGISVGFTFFGFALYLISMFVNAFIISEKRDLS